MHPLLIVFKIPQTVDEVLVLFSNPSSSHRALLKIDRATNRKSPTEFAGDDFENVLVGALRLEQPLVGLFLYS